jgi:hypothetical protein
MRHTQACVDATSLHARRATEPCVCTVARGVGQFPVEAAAAVEAAVESGVAVEAAAAAGDAAAYDEQYEFGWEDWDQPDADTWFYDEPAGGCDTLACGWPPNGRPHNCPLREACCVAGWSSGPAISATPKPPQGCRLGPGHTPDTRHNPWAHPTQPLLLLS